MIAAEAFGFVGGAMSMMQALPQARRVRALGHGRGVSVGAWVLTFVANTTWLGYGIKILSPSLTLTNLIAGGLSATVLLVLLDESARPKLLLPLGGVVALSLVQVVPEAVVSLLLVSLTLSRMPQALQSYRNRRDGVRSAVSMGSVMLSIGGLFCWEGFSILSGRPFLVLTTSTALALALCIAYLELSSRRLMAADVAPSAA